MGGECIPFQICYMSTRATPWSYSLRNQGEGPSMYVLGHGDWKCQRLLTSVWLPVKNYINIDLIIKDKKAKKMK